MTHLHKSGWLGSLPIPGSASSLRFYCHKTRKLDSGNLIDFDFESGEYGTQPKVTLTIPMSLLLLRQFGDLIQNIVAEISGDNDKLAVPAEASATQE